MSLIILSIHLLLGNLIHVGHMAEYYFTHTGSKVKLKFVIEKNELLDFDLKNDCDLKAITALCTAKYLSANSMVKINGEKISFELESSKTDGDHLIVYMNSTKNVDTIKNISIQNTCFFEINRSFKNRVILDLGLFQKSYLLTKDKNTIDLR